MIEQFWDLKLIQNPSDIYNLNFNKIASLEGWGALSVKHLQTALSKSKSISLNRFIYSIGIRHIGQENTKILAMYFRSIKKIF